MLVLPHSERLRVYLHQLGERVHQATAYAYGSPDRHVVLGKLLSRHLGGGVDGGAVLADAEDAAALRFRHPLEELLGLAAGGPVAHRNHLHIVSGYERRQGLYGLNLLICRRVGIYHVVMQQLSLGVEADQLAAGPEARVYGQQALLSHRSGKEQLAQVGTENLYGFNVRLLFRAAYEFIAHRRFQQTLVGVLDSGAQLFGDGGRREAAFLAEIVVYLVAGLLGILVYMQADETLVLRPEHSQEPVGSHFRKQLAAVEEGTVFLGLRILAAGFCRLEYYAAAAHHSPQGLAHGCAVGEFLGYYVPGTGKGGLHVSGLSFPAAESFRLCGRILAAHFIYEQGQRLEPCLFGGGGPGAALRPPRKVEVFHFPGIHRVLYPGAKFRGERTRIFYSLEYQLLALV